MELMGYLDELRMRLFATDSPGFLCCPRVDLPFNPSHVRKLRSQPTDMFGTTEDSGAESFGTYSPSKSKSP